MREILKNNPQSPLSASALSTDLTLSVVDGSVFPSTGRFRIIIDSEIMVVTGRSTNTLTVKRAQEGTTAAGHGSGVNVAQILTAGGLTQWAAENLAGWGGSRPPLALVDASGNVLTSSDFTTINLGSNTVSDSDGAVVLRMLGALGTDNITALARSYTAPATVIVGLRYCLSADRTSAFPLAGVGFRDSSGKLSFAHIVTVSTGGGACYQSAQYNSPTSQSSVSSAAAIYLPGDVVFWKLQDDNTNLKISISHDGVNWVLMHSEARGSFLTSPSQVVALSNNVGNGVDCLTSLVAWSE